MKFVARMVGRLGVKADGVVAVKTVRSDWVREVEN